ncbi:hypothetical protein BS47DRAFT_1394442 [Hydnum rufescens UP504]|uniref:Dipeptidase n=1 Tax=Hydnum rufescens UP504 TaxID=1448309 RepID=A0A9P6DSH2_9AGAM|nr:hypothetical protein BS47DRAFT_1394442 [Hydnum rufescens UP504]
MAKRIVAIGLTLFFVLASSWFLLFDQPLPNDPLDAAIEILRRHPVIDTHIDLPELVRFTYRNNVSAVHLKQPLPGHVDIPRLRSGQVGAFFWSVYTSCPADPGINFTRPTAAVRDTLEQIDVAHALIDKYPDTFTFATGAADIRTAIRRGKIASLLGVEGGHQLENSLLSSPIPLPWPFADSAGIFNYPAPIHGGLSAFGRTLIRELNRLGVIVDLSHTADTTARQAFALSEAPVIWSHSSARAVWDVPRNIPDDILLLIGEGQGKKDAVVNVNFAPSFTAGEGDATVSVIADHVEHIGRVAGRKHVGLGSDFDGIGTVPKGLEDVSKYPNLFAELYKRGWTERELAGLAGENLLRVFNGVEETAARLRKEGDCLIPTVRPPESSSGMPFPTVPRSMKACRSCRARKVKCDGQPACNGCLARNITCVYDTKQKRRGPDKIPGARRRRPGGPKEHAGPPATLVDPASCAQIYSSNTSASLLGVSATLPQPKASHDSTTGEPQHCTHTEPRQAHSPPVVHPGLGQLIPNTMDFCKVDFPTIKEVLGQHPRGSTLHTGPVAAAIAVASGVFAWHNNRLVWNNAPSINLAPSLQFYRQSWWDALLGIYSSDRQTAVQTITTDLRLFFQNSSHVLSFVRIPQFVNALLYPVGREQLQPSLPLAALALSSLMQSVGGQGQLLERAMLLQSAAQAAFEASVNAGWFDPNLVQASFPIYTNRHVNHRCLRSSNLVLIPSQSDDRSRSAFLMLDAVLSSLSLPSLDATDPSVSIFLPNAAPTVPTPHPLSPPKAHPEREWASTLAVPQLPAASGTVPPSSASLSTSTNRSCNCSSLYMTSENHGGSAIGRGWLGSPGYHPYWTETMIAREQSRTVVWNALAMFSAYSAHHIAFSEPRLKFRSAKPSNYALLFPGEALHISRGFPSEGKDSVWALYCRALLLSNSCLDMQDSPLSDDHDRAAFAIEAWLEVARIEEALNNRHTCKTEEYYFWAGRQYLQLVRMTVTYNFSKYVPSVHAGRLLPQKKETEEWIEHVQFFAKVVDHPDFIVTLRGQLRWNPYLIWYEYSLETFRFDIAETGARIFADQIARCLHLWENDNALMALLEVATQIAPILDSVVQIFSNSTYLRAYRDHLFARLQSAYDTLLGLHMLSANVSMLVSRDLHHPVVKRA